MPLRRSSSSDVVFVSVAFALIRILTAGNIDDGQHDDDYDKATDDSGD